MTGLSAEARAALAKALSAARKSRVTEPELMDAFGRRLHATRLESRLLAILTRSPGERSDAYSLALAMATSPAAIVEGALGLTKKLGAGALERRRGGVAITPAGRAAIEEQVPLARKAA